MMHGTTTNEAFAEWTSTIMLRLRKRSPFFATLALFAPIHPTTAYPTTATDGRTIFANIDYLYQIPPAQQDALILHAVLHAALLHVSRRGPRDEQVWNMAADIVVNGIIAAHDGFEIPRDLPRDPTLETCSVEEVYELLQLSPERQPKHSGLDLLNTVESGSATDRTGNDRREGSHLSGNQTAQTESHWRNALQQAQMLAQAVESIAPGTGALRELSALDVGTLDWRAHLWRYLVQTPTDFQGFDRRFVGRGLYLEALESASVHLYIAVDTSGSIQDTQIRSLVSEVQSILRSYPHLTCDLYYADDALYGPYQLRAESVIPTPVGGGSTDFQPFFTAVKTTHNPHDSCVTIYLTDGWGLFPAYTPDVPVLWVVTPGGRATDDFPFGEAVRLFAAV